MSLAKLTRRDFNLGLIASLLMVTWIGNHLRAMPVGKTNPIAEPINLFEQVARLHRVIDKTPDPWGEKIQKAMQQAIRDKDEGALEQSIAERVLLDIQINPEGRVKVQRGPGASELTVKQPRLFLLRIENRSFAQQYLKPKGTFVGRKDNPFQLEIPTFHDLGPGLQGLPVEYRLLRITSGSVGKQELTIGMEAGQGTQDIGFRGEVSVLFNVK